MRSPKSTPGNAEVVGPKAGAWLAWRSIPWRVPSLCRPCRGFRFNRAPFPRRARSLFYTSPQFRWGTARRSAMPFVQAEGLLDNSRWQVPRRAGGRRHRIGLPPKPVRPCRGRRHSRDGCSTPSGSVGWLRVWFRGRRSPAADLPTATISQPQAGGRRRRENQPVPSPSAAGFV